MVQWLVFYGRGRGGRVGREGKGREGEAHNHMHYPKHLAFLGVVDRLDAPLGLEEPSLLLIIYCLTRANGR